MSWFGIVCGITPAAAPGGAVTLLAQHHYLDGTIDRQIMLGARTGDGDFEATLKINPAKIPAPVLLRFSGQVGNHRAGAPQVEVEYARVRPCLMFASADQAKPNHSNPRGPRFAQVKLADQICTPYPNGN